MISQKTVFAANGQIIAQAESEQHIKEKADLITPEQNSIHSQVQSFISTENPNTSTPSSNNVPNDPQRQRLRNMLIGSREVVTRTIHYLHLIGYAPEADWSPLQPNPENPEEVISILVRYIRV